MARARLRKPNPGCQPTWAYRSTEHALVCANGSRIEFKGAHLPDNLRGAGLDLVVIDEAADVSEYTWLSVIKPMLLDGRGEALIVGTPRGKNHWLHRVFQLGKSVENADRYASIQLPTQSNPKIRPQDLDDYKQEMTLEEYRQEFDAEFIDGVNTIFTNVDQCIDGEVQKCGRPGVRYVTGIDLGQKRDFTVLCSLAGPE